MSENEKCVYFFKSLCNFYNLIFKKKFVDIILCDICCFIIFFRVLISVELLWFGCFRL